MFETSVSPTAPLNLDIEYQNADLWGLWGGANAPRAPTLVTGLKEKIFFYFPHPPTPRTRPPGPEGLDLSNN